MYYVYVLYSSSLDQLYYGKTSDLKRRLAEHKREKRGTTGKADDWQLIYYEAYQSAKDARQRERKLKDYGASVGHLRNRIQNSIDIFR